MSKPLALISPASRGLGFAVAKHLLRTTKVPIVTTCRTAPELLRAELLKHVPSASDRIGVLQLDVTKEDTIKSAASQFKKEWIDRGHHLRLAFIAPGILRPDRAMEKVERDDAIESYMVNTLGPLMMVKHFSGFLPSKRDELVEEEGLASIAVWANVSARVGSIGDNHLGGWVSYRASKAALNQVTKCLDLELKRKSSPAGSVSLHPGTVKTDFSRDFRSGVKEGKLFEPDYSAERLCEGLKKDNTGLFYDWDNKVVEW
ncbi:short-chain dehydrogenase/reductase SDR [Planoprotostelium fungivorum]|uniref:Short-chain dehydrogenase/reductase SDR n=1 Tax=Planoprotostelium fungivorum TaxID=1890364 RepID=A0A2P6MXH2_9EUKA|nr:short-chain dehydrogenase/reductase SDR [Planoprotostelium fungivorum]